MLKEFWFSLNPLYIFILQHLGVYLGGFLLIYGFLFFLLRPLFRSLERDIALVTLNISGYPLLSIFTFFNLKFTLYDLENFVGKDILQKILNACLIVVISYWLVAIIKKVIIYYLKQYTKQSEVMWDDVLLPLVEAVLPVMVFLLGGVFVLNNFGVDLTGIWVALGGATFIIGFALKDILANFFSGIVLLIDTPFQFGDVLRLEDGSIGMLCRIGVRVTQIYLFNHHCDIYIPNSVLQNQNITNLSRPTSYYYYSTTIEIPAELEVDYLKSLITETVLAHPDTLADIEKKIALIDRFYLCEEETNNSLTEQQISGKNRLLAEQKVNIKLQEIEEFLEALVITLQFAEKGGLTSEELENIYQEYQEILVLIGLNINSEINTDNLLNTTFSESQAPDGLIELVREWYRFWLKDPNLKEEDLYLIPQEWERKITLLKKRTYRLYQKITNPQLEETRLDDYVLELSDWFKSRFKERKKWQDPQIWITALNHDEGFLYYEFKINFFVDDIKLEYGKRGDRIASQINQEILRIVKPERKQHQ
ncbi:mechanosensitive ion channel family protein [Cyanobacterium aponinum]|uniref:MscS Mechanosensitive ion channel n=1 Tax=Cyanobacterium aponinum (strain PCC 10605) TaxID=755178 RepID=K9Z4I5_CYAAP|nr:mechanosensitive ion channel family protein [Cyanobacterium aponinum]AFZ54096.1 MscS Mechanosensitive ion channel [Cyanobacterium aponinum PCC 10605]